MKKRIIKKNINRFITPLVKGLPKVDTFGITVTTIVDGVEVETTFANNHTIVNGIEKQAGERILIRQDLIKNIRLTALKAQEIINSYNHVYFRLFEIRGNYVRMRLITEKVQNAN